MDKNKREKRNVPLPHTRRLKSLKRPGESKEKSSKKDEIQLESVLGITISNSASLSSSKAGTLAYPAGCVVVLLNVQTGQQRHIINDERKTVTCLGWSGDGQHLVTGESGHMPHVKIWSVVSLTTVTSFKGHKFGVSNVKFTTNNHYVVSIGAEHDMTVNVWDWKNNCKVASNKISFHVKSIGISPDGSHFVAVGNRHLKYWYVDKGRMSVNGTIPLQGRSAILGEKKNNNFLDVAFGKEKMGEYLFVITKSGLLCQLNSQRLLEKWVELKVKSACSLCVSEKYILVGCTEGIIRCFSVNDLRYICSLPKPDAEVIPDVVAMSYDEIHATLSVVYTDHSLIVWDVSNLSQVNVISSHNYHAACIWGVDTYRGTLSSGSCLVTCSNDDTLRLWTLDHGPLSNSGLECHLQKVVPISNNGDGDHEKQKGIKCVRVSPDECFIATGDRSGNIRVHNTKTLDEVCKIEAHDSEIMSLKFAGDRFLASASRDRLIHLFDVDNNFEFLTTVDEHSSCVTSVDFLTNGDEDVLISSGADKSILSRKVSYDNDGGISLTRSQHIVCKTVPYDMVVGGSQILVACQDRAVRSYPTNCPNSKAKILKGSSSDDGSLFRMTLDKSESYYATSCSDKTIGVFHYPSGEMIATLQGHSDLVTGLVFSYDCQFLISVSGDSCIFVWKLPKKMSIIMTSKLNITLSEETSCLSTETNIEEFGSPTKEFFKPSTNSSPDPMYRFSVGKLPIWARKKVVTGSESESAMTKPVPNSVQSPRGKWANKVGDATNEVEDILRRYEDNEEPNVGSVDKTKKLLFQQDDDNEEFMVNAIDADTLRSSHKELNLPTSEDSTTIAEDDLENTLEDGLDKSVCDEHKSCALNLNVTEQESTTVSRKLTSISNAWREGTTPVQQRKNGVSIEKLLATNQLHALLKNISPDKSPHISLDLSKETEKSGVSGKPPLIISKSSVKPTVVQRLNCDSGTLSRDSIKDAVAQVKESTNKLLVLFKRVSLDEDLDDNLRQELMMTISGGASEIMETLKMVQPGFGQVLKQEDNRSQEEIASAAMDNIRKFLNKNISSGISDK